MRTPSVPFKPKVGVLIQLSPEIAQSLAMLSELGFTSGQLACENMSLYNNDFLNTVKRAQAKNNFDFTAFYCGWAGYYTYTYPDMYTTLGLVPDYLRDRRINNIISGMDFAADLGIGTVLSHIGYLPDNPLDATHIQVLNSMRTLIPVLQKNKQVFIFETGEMLPITLKMLILALGEDQFGVNLDPGNFLMNGRANPVDALTMLASYIKGVHAKDATYPKGTSPKGRETPLGKGESDFEGIIRGLKAAGYQGEITIENEMYTPQRRQQLIDGKAYLEALIDKVNNS